jgi:hypothetical protein
LEGGNVMKLTTQHETELKKIFGEDYKYAFLALKNYDDLLIIATWFLGLNEIPKRDLIEKRVMTKAVLDRMDEQFKKVS